METKRKQKLTLALFDFDGTITKNDSMIKFIRFAAGDFKFLVGFTVLLPVLISYKLKLMSNHKAKEIVLCYFFKGWSEAKFVKMASEYSLNHIKKILRPEAVKKINWHRQNGHKVVVISASLECWLRPWCEANDLELIATKFEIKNGRISGKYLGKNCYGIEKANRIKELYDLSKYNKIYAYGDSKGDKEMLALADERFYKPFV